jgi:pimeloyl-ACP methyl ester carboxylesterase
LGGVLGALLATGWFGIDVHMVFALSVKTRWTEADLQKFRAIAEKPVVWMDAQDEAKSRFIRASGLSGLAEPSSSVVQHGVVEDQGRFRFATDPRVIGSTGYNVDVIIRAARCSVRFAGGGNDQLAPADEQRTFDPHMAVIPGAGHNVHMEKPADVWALFTERWREHG